MKTIAVAVALLALTTVAAAVAEECPADKLRTRTGPTGITTSG
jgi:hypothetical protein